MAYYNAPVESKTVKFDIIVHLRDSTFTPAAMQSPTTYKFKEIPIEEANSQVFYETSLFEEMSLQHAVYAVLIIRSGVILETECKNFLRKIVCLEVEP